MRCAFAVGLSAAQQVSDRMGDDEPCRAVNDVDASRAWSTDAAAPGVG